MHSKKMKTNSFIAMWDMHGLEALIDLNTIIEQQEIWKKEKIWNTLKEVQSTDTMPNVPLNIMIMRAKANPQRHYEIYSIVTEKSIKYNDMIKMFKINPQNIVDLIRKKGKKIYSDEHEKKGIIK